MSAEHRRRGIWGVVTEDRYRKLVAIGLAVLLWWFIDRRITDSWTVPMVLKAGDAEQLETADRISNKLDVYLPTGGRVVQKRFLDGDQEIEQVNVTFSGPRFEIDGLRERERLQLEVVKFLDHTWRANAANGEAGTPEVDLEVVEFTAADIRQAFQLDGVQIELSPARVLLEVEIRESISVALTTKNVRFDAGGSKDRLRLDSVEFKPRRMEIVGPAVTMGSLEVDNSFVFYAELNVEPGDAQVSAVLRVIDGADRDIYPVGDPATVTIQLEPDRKTYTLTLPLKINDLRKNPTTFYEAEEKELAVDVSFAGALARDVKIMKSEDVQGWAASNFKLEVNITDDVVVETFSPRPMLIPNGLILSNPNYKHSDYELQTSRTVRVRKKQ